ncbi:MAG: hypothetical protein ABIH35_02190 [Patescibacteria group bacterium]
MSTQQAEAALIMEDAEDQVPEEKFRELARKNEIVKVFSSGRVFKGELDCIVGEVGLYCGSTEALLILGSTDEVQVLEGEERMTVKAEIEKRAKETGAYRI